MDNIMVFTLLMTIANTFSSGTTNGFCGIAQSQIEIRFQVPQLSSSAECVRCPSDACSVVSAADLATVVADRDCVRDRGNPRHDHHCLHRLEGSASASLERLRLDPKYFQDKHFRHTYMYT